MNCRLLWRDALLVHGAHVDGCRLVLGRLSGWNAQPGTVLSLDARRLGGGRVVARRLGVSPFGCPAGVGAGIFNTEDDGGPLSAAERRVRRDGRVSSPGILGA